MRLFVVGAGILLPGACAHRLPEQPAARAFDYSADRLAYANETVWRYENGKVLQVPEEESRAGDEKYTRRCFIVTRSMLQFWKFARFEKKTRSLPDKELARRVRELARIDVWKDPFPKEKRIVFPGYANLFELSGARRRILQSNLGTGWTIYLRPGNTSMVFPPSRAHQERTFDELKQSLAMKQPSIVWMVTFPSLALNHSVLVFGIKDGKEKAVFTVADPNNTRGPEKLEYNKATRTFSFQPTFYFKGGPVDVRTIYWSPMQ